MCNALAYVSTEKSPLYTAIMRAFVESKARFLTHLRLQDICDVLQTPAQAEIESALAQLCEWGNLEMIPDRSGIRTAAEFHRPRHVFQMTIEGEAAEQALAVFHSIPQRQIVLPCTALTDVVDVLQELKQLARDGEPGARTLRRCLQLLHSCFEDVTATGQMLVRGLEQRAGVQQEAARRLIDHAEKFLADLVVAQECVAEAMREIEAAGIQQLLPAERKRDSAQPQDAERKRNSAQPQDAERKRDSAQPQDAERKRDSAQPQEMEWDQLRQWFISHPSRPSNAELLRERIRTSIPVLLDQIARINDRQLYRIDRSNDFRVLARWFAEAESDAEAHRLWRTVFGLCPARHLAIDDATLDDFEAQDVPAETSWLDAPPVRISMRARAGDPHTGMLSRIIDRTAEKEKLAAAAHDEALRILSAQARFGSGRRMRLSELELLEAGEFDLFLDLLADATSMEVVSDDGFLRVRLEPTNDGREAAIMTTEGVFSGPDHWISIEREEVV